MSQPSDKHALHLLRAYDVLESGHEVRKEEPLVKGNVAALYNRARADGKLVAAVVAEEHAGRRLAFRPANAKRATVWARRLTVPARDFDVGERFGFVMENRVCDVRCHAQAYVPCHFLS